VATVAVVSTTGALRTQMLHNAVDARRRCKVLSPAAGIYQSQSS
jgi:hypothetical protein